MIVSAYYIILGCLLIILCGIEGIYCLNHYEKLVSFLKLVLYMDLPIMLLVNSIKYMYPMTNHIREIANFCFGVTGLIVSFILGAWIINQLIRAIYFKLKF